jgi:acylphosphatase
LPIKQFEIHSDGQIITGIGLRAQIYMTAYKYSVRVIPQNVTKELVRVVASGDDNSLDTFYKDVLDYCTARISLKTENVTKMENYSGLEPKWSHYGTLFGLEQTAKGVTYLQKTYDKLNDIELKFGAIGEGMKISNQKLEKLDSLPEIEKTLEKLTAILEKLAPNLQATSPSNLPESKSDSKDKK